MLHMKILIHTDGGARGNPGPAAVGVVIETETAKTIAEFGKRIGETTNNVAEYTAVIEALKYLQTYISLGHDQGDHIESVNFYLDSTLVVNQINGLFKVKQDHLRLLLLQVHELEHEVGRRISYFSIPRELNSRADYFVNTAFDE